MNCINFILGGSWPKYSPGEEGGRAWTAGLWSQADKVTKVKKANKANKVNKVNPMN